MREDRARGDVDLEMDCKGCRSQAECQEDRWNAHLENFGFVCVLEAPVCDGVGLISDAGKSSTEPTMSISQVLIRKQTLRNSNYI